MEDTNQLFSLYANDVAGEAVVEIVQGIELLGMEQYESFTKKRLIDRKTSLSEPIKEKKMALVSSPATKTVSSSNHQLISLKSDITLYITTLHLLPNNIDATAIDGPAMVNMLNPGTARTFQQYAEKSILSYIQSKCRYSNHLDAVWDRYIGNSLKASNRSKSGTGIREKYNLATNFQEIGKAFSE